MNRRRRSPLRSGLRRLPGQSVDEHLRDRAFDDVLFPYLVAVVLVILALMEWYWVYHPRKPQPVFLSVLAALSVCYALYKVWRHLPELRALKLARDGERAVAELLDRLRDDRYMVLHDIPGDGFNIDHIVVGPTGVYTIETKTLSKPAEGDARIYLDGEGVRVGSRVLDRDPIAQSRAQAGWLRELLRETTGRQVAVRPVVVFPGWFVERRPGAPSDVWVLNPKAPQSFLKNEQICLTDEDRNLLTYHLSRYVRGHYKR